MIALLLLIRERVGRPARQIQIGEDMDILAAGGAERLAMTRFFDRARRAIMAGRLSASSPGHWSWTSSSASTSG
jgi:hypothetical protein